MKVYIAGKITNNPNYKEEFAKAENFLKSKGCEVVNPAKNQGNSYKEYIDIGLFQLMQCDAIYLLSNYRDSVGAQLELQYAKAVGMYLLHQ